MVVADAGYDFKENRKAVKRARAEPVIAVNPRSWLALNKFKTVYNDNVNDGRGHLYGQRSSYKSC
jgi:IS5 family transposase